MKNKNIFSWARLYKYSVAQIKSDRRELLLVIGVICLACLLSKIPSLIYALGDGESSTLQNISHTASSVIKIWAFIYLASNLASSFIKYINPLTAPLMMTLPVSKIENFTFAALRNMIFIPFITFASIYAIDYLFLGLPGSEILVEHQLPWWYTLSTGANMLFLASCFFLCAILFTKRQFLNASLLLLIFVLVFTTNWMATTTTITMESGITIVRHSVQIIVPLIMSLALIYIAWRKFRKLQIR